MKKIGLSSIGDYICPGERVLFSCHCGEPLTLLDALVKQDEKLKGLRLISGLLFSQYSFLNSSSFSFATWQSTPRLGGLISQGKVEYLPLRYSQTVSAFLPNGPLPIDAILVRISPPDKEGYCSIGISPSYSLPICLSGKKVFAEISEEIPRSFGNSFIHQSQIDYYVESAFPPSEYFPGIVGKTEEKVAENVMALIDDDATIQLGIGKVPCMVARKLYNRRRIAIHSGMVSDDVIGLVEKGVIPISKAGKKSGIVVGELIGSKALFTFANENPIFEMATVDYIYNPNVIGQIRKFVAVNSAVEIDLFGQVNSEIVSGLQVGGVGGSLDFCVGASLSPGGKSIVATTSTGQRGPVSRIVPYLSSFGTVTIPRYYVDYVVTEYGVACLRGKSIEQRADALIGVADPRFRNSLSNDFEAFIRAEM